MKRSAVLFVGLSQFLANTKLKIGVSESRNSAVALTAIVPLVIEWNGMGAQSALFLGGLLHAYLAKTIHKMGYGWIAALATATN